MNWPSVWDEVDGFDYRAAAAIHEAGHAVMLCRWKEVLGVDVGAVQIEKYQAEGIDGPDGVRYAGRCHLVGVGPHPAVTRAALEARSGEGLPPLFRRHSARRHKAAALLALAGITAAQMAGDEMAWEDYATVEDGPGNDFFQLDNHIGAVCLLLTGEDKDAPGRYVEALAALCSATLRREWEALTVISRALYDCGVLPGEEVEALFRKHAKEGTRPDWIFEGKRASGPGGEEA